ncbi:hypothetical protein ABZ547_32105 [Streptomyces sparsogenes]|uniref:hypothetical protein n=1 Tax=Streptomyces sparsogenes TaxID=67365 RepID=UPI0034086724
MAKVSAIPENLFAYAEACTRGAEQFQQWVSAYLTSALRDGERSGVVPPSSLDSSGAKWIAAAFYTDRDVGTVGRAFQEAGGPAAGGPAAGGPAKPVSASEQAVNAAFQRLQTQYAQQSRSAEAGAALARRMEQAGGLGPILAELGRHADDPHFAAGFYNQLDGERIRRLMSDPTGIKALVSAFASGAVSGETADKVTRQLGWDQPGILPELPLPWKPPFPWESHHDGVPPDDQIAFLKALLANRTAASQFAYHLDDPELLRIKGTYGARVSGLGMLLDQIHATHPSWPGGAKAPTDADLSWELRGANALPYPSVAPQGVGLDGKPYSRDELAVLSWIELHKDTILQEARRWNIDPRAIVGAIAWEALKNKDRWWQDVRDGLPARPPLDYHLSAGPGKVHIDTEIVKQIEAEGYLPRQGEDGRRTILRTSDGSIRYIAAILGAYSKVTEQNPDNEPIRNNVPVLVNLYQGSDLNRWRNWLNTHPGAPYDPGNPMGKWALSPEGRRLLNDSLRLWDQE